MYPSASSIEIEEEEEQSRAGTYNNNANFSILESDGSENAEHIHENPHIHRPNEEEGKQQQDDDDDEKLPKSSIENILPMKKIVHGVSVLNNWVKIGAKKTQEKVEEINQTETVQNIKATSSAAWKKTVETTAPLVDKTVEVASPAWHKTGEISSNLIDKTVKFSSKVAEDLKPAANAAVSTASAGWSSLSSTVSKGFHELSGNFSSSNNSQNREGGDV